MGTHSSTALLYITLLLRQIREASKLCPSKMKEMGSEDISSFAAIAFLIVP